MFDEPKCPLSTGMKALLLITYILPSTNYELGWSICFPFEGKVTILLLSLQNI